ncbi:MAG: hypothetical protein WC277_09215 [Bacilli bacterium]
MPDIELGTLPPRVWVCDECGDRRCILVRDDPPVDRLDAGCPWSALHARWHEANHVDGKPADLLAIADDLSTATGQILAEAIAASKEVV